MFNLTFEPHDFNVTHQFNFVTVPSCIAAYISRYQDCQTKIKKKIIRSVICVIVDFFVSFINGY